MRRKPPGRRLVQYDRVLRMNLLKFLIVFVFGLGNKLKMESGDFKQDIRRLRVFILLWCLATLAVFTFVVAGPITDLVYVYQRSDGSSVDITYGPGWYPVTAFVVVNYLLLAITYSVVADPDSPARVDLHQLAVYAAMVGNGIVFVVFAAYYFFWINSLLAGYLPFNDYRWCCVYFLDQIGFCPNTDPCVDPNDGLGSHNLNSNNAFKLIWTFSVVFFAFSTVQRVFNLTLRRTGSVVAPSDKPKEGEILAYLTNASNLGFYVYWAAWPLLNTIHEHGYPTLGIPPGPGPFQSVRYNYPWIALGILGLNLLPPLLFQMSLTIQTTQFWHIIHLWVTIVITIISFVVILVLLWFAIPLVGYCNFFNSAGSICNDYRWCCNYFSDAPDWCPNVTPCPNVGALLLPNADYTAHIILGIVFLIYNGVSLWLNFRMRKYGIFSEATAY